MNPASAPSFCSLEGRQLQDRAACIADLNRRWLRQKKLDSRTLTLVYDTGARDALEALLLRERQCCGSLKFDLASSAAGLQLSVTAPAETGGDVESQLAIFVESDLRSEAECCGSCEPSPKAPAGRRIAGAAATTSVVAALACGACCVLPIAIPAIATGMSGVALAWLARSHQWMTILAALLVASSWSWIGWHSIRTKKRPAASTLILMGLAIIAAGAALLWPQLEHLIFATIKAS